MPPAPKVARAGKQSTLQSATSPPVPIATEITEDTPLFGPGPSGTNYSDSEDNETTTTCKAPAPPRLNVDISDDASDSEPASPSEDDDDYESDEDPVVREYDIFMTEELAESLYLFQYPVRSKTKPYNKAQSSCPVDARWKPKAGLVEVDVPVNTAINFDQEKGRIWGDVLRKNQQAKESGLPGKAIGPRAGKRRKVKGEDDDEEEDDIMFVDFQEAVKKGRILSKQTLGSKIQADEAKYMVGVFTGGTLSTCTPPSLFCTYLNLCRRPTTRHSGSLHPSTTTSVLSRRRATCCREGAKQVSPRRRGA